MEKSFSRKKPKELTNEMKKDLVQVGIDPGISLKSFLSFINEGRMARFIITKDLRVILSSRLHVDIRKTEGFKDCLLWDGCFQVSRQHKTVNFFQSFSTTDEEVREIQQEVKDKIKVFLESNRII